MNDPWAFQRWAYETTTGSPLRKALLMTLAAMADMNTGRCEARQDTLAQAVETTDRSVRANLKILEGDGIIARRRQIRRDGARRNDEFLLLAPWVTEWPDGGDLPEAASGGPTGSSTQSLPEASDNPYRKPASGQEQPRRTTTLGTQPYDHREERREETSELPPSEQSAAQRPARECAGARARGRTVRFRSRAVPEKIAAEAEAALERWGEATGQTMRFVNGSGKLSDSASRIVGAMLDYPEVVDLWPTMIERGLTDPWWEDRGVPPSTGVIFGPKVVEQSIAKAQQPVLMAMAGGAYGRRSGEWTAREIFEVGQQMDAEEAARKAGL